MRRRKDGKYFAMKTISKALVSRQPENACFMEERLIMTHDTQWLVRLEESFQDELFLYIVMEYMAGGDLSSMDEEQTGLPEDQVRFYVAEVVLALEELHSIGYAHRDVKPGNVMLGEDGHVKLADFGSAGKLDREGRVHSRSSVGTPDYVSPEALRAQESRGGVSYDAKCDWWGVGVMLFELLTGEPPFYAPSLVQTYQKIADHRRIMESHSELGKLSGDALDLLRHLLCPSEDRFGAAQIKQHRFFDSVDWQTIRLRTAPFVPLLGSPEDTSRFFLDEDDEGPQLSGCMKSSSRRNVFEGSQLAFVGYTHCPRRGVYQVTQEEAPMLQSLAAGSRLRLEELEAQVEDLRISGETAKLVSEQIRRTTSMDEMAMGTGGGLATASPISRDALQAAHEALLQNYEFIQTHYEELLAEHANTSRQFQALLVTMQEQEVRQRALEAELEEGHKRSALDKIKINELVSKLATTLATKKPADSYADEMKVINGTKEKQLLKAKGQECKMLEAQLRAEMLARQRLETEMAEAIQQRDTLQAEHEALLAALRPSSRIERRPSDGSMLRSLVQARHVRQGSSVSSLGPNAMRMEGPVKILCGGGKQRRGGLAWEKALLAIRDGVLWIGERELVSLRDPAFIVWVQPVEAGDLLHLGTKHIPLCFKLRMAERRAEVVQQPEVEPASETKDAAEEMASLAGRIAKEERILRGAMQLLDAARTAEQQAVALAHADACKRKMAQLRGQQEQLQAASETGSMVSTGAGDDQHRWRETNDDCSSTTTTGSNCMVCYRPFVAALGGFACTGCGSRCHRECKEILPLACSEASALAGVLPAAFFMASSAEEARRWLRSIEAAQRACREV